MATFAAFAAKKSAPPTVQHLCLARVGELDERFGKYTVAIRSFESAVSTKPKWSMGRRMLARAYLAVNRPAEALPHIRRALALEPKESRNHALLGSVQGQLGHSRSAIEAFQKAIEFDPGNGLLHFQLGLEYEGSGQKLSAIRSYMAARRLAGSDGTTADLLAQIDQALERAKR